MKLLFLLLVIFTFASCHNSSSNGSSDSGHRSSGQNFDLINQQAAVSFIKESNQEIPPSLQLSQDELKSLQEEGLLTSEEYKEISDYIQ